LDWKRVKGIDANRNDFNIYRNLFFLFSYLESTKSLGTRNINKDRNQFAIKEQNIATKYNIKLSFPLASFPTAIAMRDSFLHLQ
jgi:hypothetical protein